MTQAFGIIIAFVTTFFVLSFTRLIVDMAVALYRMKDKDSREAGSLFKMILAVCLLLLTSVAIGAYGLVELYRIEELRSVGR